MKKFTLKAQNLLFKPPTGDLWSLLFDKNVLVAFSGGKDSLALLAYMLEHQASCGWQLAACHVNHHLRAEESLRDEAFCRQWCEAHGVTFFCYEDTIVKDDRGIEAAARKLRYTLLHECAVENGMDYIATAHTASDQLESFFVDLLTGVSVFTLGGIADIIATPLCIEQNAIMSRPTTPSLRATPSPAKGNIKWNDIKIIRPMLDISTYMVNEYLAEHGLTAIYDSTNSDTRYLRNFVRARLLPCFDDSHMSRLKASITGIQEESQLLDDYFNRMTAHFVSLPTEGGVIISRACLDSAELVLQRYILGKCLSVLARGGAVHTNAILKQLQEPRSVRIDLPEGHFCEITPRAVRIFHKDLVQPFEYNAADCKNLPDGVKAIADIVRSRRNGDRYKGKKLKDLFERCKLDLYDRDRAIVAEARGEIVWVEYINE